MFAFRRTMASLAPQASSLKQAGKVVCIGRNFAYVFNPQGSPAMLPTD